VVLWLQALHEAGQDTQAVTAGEDAIQLVTHHGAKGLEWHIVVAMDLAAKLKPRLWGLSVLPVPGTLDLDRPLAGRRLRYWPAFSGNHSSDVPLLDAIADGPEGRSALAREVQEARRLLYVSLTRARDGLILTRDGGADSGPWMDTLQAAALRVKLRYLEDWIEARRQHATLYTRLLAGNGVVTPVEYPDSTHVYHLYVVRTPRRDALQAYLREQGVGTAIHYPIPIHLQPYYAENGFRPGQFPVTEGLCDEVLSLPMFPEMTAKQVEDVAARVADFYECASYERVC